MNSPMSTSKAPVATNRSARPSVLSSIHRHLTAVVLVAIFAAGLALALALAVSPLDLGDIAPGVRATGAGMWTR